MKKIRYGIQGMNCAACVAHVEHAAAKILPSEQITVSLMTNSITLTVEDNTDEKKLRDALKKSLSASGYRLLDGKDRQEGDPSAEWKNGLRRLILSAIFTLLLMTVAMGEMIGLPLPSFLTENGVVFGSVQLILALIVVLLNFHFFRNGFFALFHRAPNMDSLIAIGASASMIYGCVAIGMMGYGMAVNRPHLVHEYYHNLYFESAAMILTLVSLGKTLEGKAKAGAAAAVGRLAAMMPRVANVEEKGEMISVPLSQLQVGDVIVVREGETIPADGVVIEGAGSVDESPISGESIPIEKKPGDPVVAVCVLQSGYLKVQVERVGKDTALSRIIQMLEDAAASKAPIARLADRVSGIFVPAVITIALITAIVWLIATGDVARAFSCSVSVLVISCPCALGLATPTAVMVGVSRGAEKGILIKSSEALEHLQSVKFLMTDKTGTLTRGDPSVTDLLIAEGIREEELLEAAYGAERMSTHPLALAVCREAKNRGMATPEVTQYESYPGRGIAAQVRGKTVLVGRPEYLKEMGVEQESPVLLAEMKKLEAQGKTAVAVSSDGILLGVLGIADTLRQDSVEAIAAFQKMGVTPVMLTGDHEQTAYAIAERCGIDAQHVYAKLLPEDKERILRQYSAKGRCAMVGDGINDAPALSAADIGIAIGAGTEVAVDCADVVLSRNSLLDAVCAVDLSRATLRCIKQNLFWALLYNSICIPLAAGVLYPAFGIALSPMIGSAAMSVSSVCVVLNSLRLKVVNLYGDGHKQRRERRKKEKQQININQQKEEADMFGKTKTVTLSVEGMMCNRCREHVEKALLAQKGVKSCTVDLEQKQVTVVAKESVEEQALKKAVVDAGYRVL